MSTPHSPAASWFDEARFGLFIHYGVYARLGRGEWAMAQEGWERKAYKRVAADLRTDPKRVRSWASTARRAGMRYAVLTAKHHDGFCLWDAHGSDFNSVRLGPGFDLVEVFLEACREEGLRTGLYYSLADWTHPDGTLCERDEAARNRFLNYTHGLVTELVTRYGDIDLLWFDGPWPLGAAENWRADDLVETIRKHQPGLLLNDRLGEGFKGDFITSERAIEPHSGRWEACMTMNDDWGYAERSSDDWVTVKDIALMLRKCCVGHGNLLLNVGPCADGNLPALALKRLEGIGAWLEAHGDAVYPPSNPPAANLPSITNTGYWTRRDHTAWLWLARVWPGTELNLGGLRGDLLSAELMGHDADLTCHFAPHRWSIHGLPAENPDPHANLPILRLTFRDAPAQVFPYPYTSTAEM